MYVVPTVTSIDIDRIKYLDPVDDGVVWSYLRVSWPDGDEFTKTRELYPESTHVTLANGLI